ncbi:MAG: family 20 glycosylhydrolase [Candidatus Eisenbacteria bacterium]
MVVCHVRLVGFCLAVLIAPIAVAASSNLPIIPQPAYMEIGHGAFCSGPKLEVDADPVPLTALRRAIEADGGPELSSLGDNLPELTLAIDDDLLLQLGEEGYQLSVRPDAIDARAARPVGLFYAIQTLRQLAWAGGESSEWVIPCCEIKDRPRFAWRGFMLDESRHFSGPDAVKRLLDAMGLLKLNRFHWHLTDAPAWRIEIRQLPRLTEIGSLTRTSDGRQKSEFYTQEQVREIVAYALERGITIVPEISMPGHATAANRAYPEYSGGNEFTLNPAGEATFLYLETILCEVAEMFPDAGMIHLGGDEVNYGWQAWPELREVKELMAMEGLRSLRAVEAHFKRRMASFVASLGMKAGFWMAGAEEGISGDQVVLYWWQNHALSELGAALDRGCPVVLCPVVPCFFDFVQDSSHLAGGLRPAGDRLVNTLHSVYIFPDSLVTELPKSGNVFGIQANLWTESAVTQESRDFLAFPRLFALAEAAWTSTERKDYAGFEERLKSHLPRLRAAGIAPWDPFAETPKPILH